MYNIFLIRWVCIHVFVLSIAHALSQNKTQYTPLCNLFEKLNKPKIKKVEFSRQRELALYFPRELEVNHEYVLRVTCKRYWIFKCKLRYFFSGLLV